jgi:hypothetical protein
MTAAEFTKSLPKLTNNPLPSKPPFTFRGLSSRIFPLRASLDTLQQLCDGYLNFRQDGRPLPPEAGYFRAAAPYAYLMVLDYSQMGEAYLKGGWFSQTEVFFGTTVEWYKLINGKWTFYDWAVITPYIFVNDDFSMPLGRTVYGFQKILAQVAKTKDPWMRDTLAPATLARIETAVFPEAYSGTGIEQKILLEIKRSTQSNMRVPFDPRSPLMPWNVVQNMAEIVGGMGRDALWALQSMRISPVNPLSDPSFIPAMLTKVIPWLGPGGKGFIQNSLNLKQFRHSEDPSTVCFQALTNGCMRTTGFNGGGLLGEDCIYGGDLSGGHSIRLHEYSSLPIATTMGLETSKSWKDGKVKVSELKPVMPFWVDVDIEYYNASNVAWRTEDGIWRDSSGVAFDSSQKPAKKGKGPQFNGTVASAIEAVAGPFQYGDTTIRVLPLLADKNVLQTFLDGYMNKPLSSPIQKADGTASGEEVRFTVWARPKQAINPGMPIGGDLAYVYLTATSFGNVTSGSNNVGNWAKYELSFMIPVKFERKSKDGEWTTASVGLVPAFMFVDQCIAAFSRMEVQGIAAATATFLRPESAWLSEKGEVSDPEQTLLLVEAETYAAYSASEKAKIQPVIEIVQGAPGAGVGKAPEAPWQWAEYLRKELRSKSASKTEHHSDLKAARALALELLGNQTPFSIYTLKQLRDVGDPDKACYQSLVQVPRSLKDVFDVREIEDTLMVRIHDYPSLQIAMALGIVSERLDGGAAGVIHTAQAVRPFFIRATLTELLAPRLMWRSGTSNWTLEEGAFLSMLNGTLPITVDWRAETLVDQVDPTLTATVMSEARQNRANWGTWDRDAEMKRLQARGNAPETPEITPEDARKALDIVDAQMVIESVLSREWNNHDPHAHWRKGKRELMKAFAALPQRGAIKAYAEAELYRRINNSLSGQPGAVAGELPLEPLVPPADGAEEPVDSAPAFTWERVSHVRWRQELENIIERNREFTDLRLKMEECVDVLVPIQVLGMSTATGALQQTDGNTLDAAKVLETGRQLLQTLRGIRNLEIEGEPSERNNLDNHVQADNFRLRDLLDQLEGLLDPTASLEASLEFARQHGEEYQQAVELARRCCDAQHEALLNKLARAYQKPDFCIRRDALGPGCDDLLPLSFSWDAEWYYGENIRLEPE